MIDGIADSFGDVVFIDRVGKIDCSTHAAAGTEAIGMSKTQIDPTVTAHAESGNGSSGTVGNGPVQLIDLVRHFQCYIRFVTRAGIQRTVPIPAAVATFRANNQELFPIGQVFQFRDSDDPIAEPAAVAVQQVNDGIAFGLGSLVGGWFYDHAGKSLVHGLAGNGD